MRYECSVTLAFSAPGRILTVCGSDFTWLAGLASVRPRSMRRSWVSEVFIWSSARIAGVPGLELLAQSTQDREKYCREIEQEVRYANITIIEGIGASQHGIGMVSARIAEIVVRDERLVIPIGSYNREVSARSRGGTAVAGVADRDLVET